MSTSTNQPDDQDCEGAVDRALAHIAGSTGPMLVEPLSDLSRSAARYLAERWPTLPAAVRLAAVNAMREDADAHIEHTYGRALLVALKDADPAIRLAALEGLTELESPSFRDVLLTNIESEPDDRVRASEAMALGKFVLLCEHEEGDEATSDRLRQSLLALLQHDPSAEVRRRALESVGYLAGDREVIRRIDDAYESGDHGMRVSALHAMGRQADTRWLDIVHDEFTSDDPELRFEAVTAAGTIGSERSVVELIDRLRDDDIEVQMAAIASLGAIGGRLAVSALRRLTEDDSPAIVDAAEAALEEAELSSSPLRPLM